MTGPFLDTTTKYVFVDKATILAKYNLGLITDAQLAQLKVAARAATGKDWDDLPGKYETYSIDGLGSWEYQP